LNPNAMKRAAWGQPGCTDDPNQIPSLRAQLAHINQRLDDEDERRNALEKKLADALDRIEQLQRIIG
jgi:septal ring factor EnvC (AmiA/AmiB activator)